MAITLENAGNTLGHIFTTAKDNKYLIPRPDESTGDYIKRVGVTVAQRELGPAVVDAAGKSLGIAGGAAASSAMAAASAWVNSGDAGKAAIAGGTQYALSKAGEYAAKEALASGASTATSAVVGKSVGAVGGLALSVAMGNKPDNKGMISTALKLTPAAPLGYAMDVMDIGKGIHDKQKAKTRKLPMSYDATTGDLYISGRSGSTARERLEMAGGSGIDTKFSEGLSNVAGKRRLKFEEHTAGWDPVKKRAYAEDLGVEYFNPTVRMSDTAISDLANVGSDFDSAKYFSERVDQYDVAAPRSLQYKDVGGSQESQERQREFLRDSAAPSTSGYNQYLDSISQQRATGSSVTEGLEEREGYQALRGTGDKLSGTEQYNPWA